MPGPIKNKTMNLYLRRMGAGILLSIGVGGCVTTAYTPQPTANSSMSFDQALATIKRFHGHACLEPPLCGVSGHSADITDITVVGNNLRLIGKENKVVMTYPLKTIHAVVLGGLRAGQVEINEKVLLIDMYAKGPDPNELADAITRLPFLLKQKEEELSAFDATAKTYREAAVKPVPGEDVRRYKIQAEAAIQDKQFDEAAKAYDQGLKLAPWWPQGHFNLALLLAETKQFANAIVEMKRYLALVPDAPDARAAQDKIYEWERKAGK